MEEVTVVVAHNERATLRVDNGVLPAGLVDRNREIAGTVIRPWTPVFMHGDLQITHVFTVGDEVTGVID